jgi:hypothetical protein
MDGTTIGCRIDGAHDMKPIPLAVLALCAALPAVAQTPVPPAPADDLARCERLFALYERYSNTGGESRSGSAFDGIEARQAVEGCRRGRIREGIAVLERKLRAQGFRP